MNAPSRLAAACLALALGGSPSFAKDVPFRHSGAPVTLTVPDAWSVSGIDDGLELRSADGEVYLWIQGLAAGKVNAAMDAYIAYYEKQGVVPTGPLQTKDDAIQGVPVAISSVPATWKGTPTIVQFLTVAPVSDDARGKVILTGYWASPKGDGAHRDAVARILSDLVRRR